MDPVKLDGIAQWPVPTKVKDAQSFLGFTNFYQWFIPNYFNIAHPLICYASVTDCQGLTSKESFKVGCRLIEWIKSLVSSGVTRGCYGPITGTHFSMDLMFLLLWSYHFRLQTMGRFSMRTHLSHALHISQTHLCIMANVIPSNLTLFLTVHSHAVHGYAATHMHITHIHASLPFCHHHVVASLPPILICLSQTALIDLISTCTYSMIVYKSQGIDWHPQSDSLGDFTL